MTLKNSNKEILKNFQFFFTLSIFIIVKCILDFPTNLLSFFIIVIGGVVLLLLPAIYLFFQHKRNGNNKIIIIEQNLIKEMFDNKLTLSKSFEEIDYVLYARGANLDDKVYIPFTIHEKFNFLKIVFKNGENVIITSCMISNLKEVKDLFDTSKVIWVKTGWCSLNRNYDYEINLWKKKMIASLPL